MIFKHRDSTSWVISLLNMSFVSLMYIIMERIFKSQSEKLISSLKLKSDSSNDSFISAPTHGNTSSSIEKSRSNLMSFEVLLKSSFFHVPSNNFNNIIGFVPNLDLMQTISIPVISLVDVSAVEVILDIVVMSKVVSWVYESVSHMLYLTKIY